MITLLFLYMYVGIGTKFGILRYSIGKLPTIPELSFERKERCLKPCYRSAGQLLTKPMIQLYYLQSMSLRSNGVKDVEFWVSTSRSRLCTFLLSPFFSQLQGQVTNIDWLIWTILCSRYHFVSYMEFFIFHKAFLQLFLPMQIAQGWCKNSLAYQEHCPKEENSTIVPLLFWIMLMYTFSFTLLLLRMSLCYPSG